MEISSQLLTYLNVGVIGALAMLLVRAILNRGGAVAETDISRRISGRSAEEGRTPTPADFVARKPKRRIDDVADVLARPLEGSEYERSQLSLKLAQAGYRQERAVAAFLSVKLLLAVLGLGGGWLLFARFGPQPSKWYEMVAWILGGMCLGFFAPQLWLNMAASSRSQKIIKGLPDSLDMLVVMVEAGLGLDAGIQRCADEIQKAYPEIADEWRLAARETQMGLSRAEAMRKMAQRTGVPEMQALVAILTQAERFGTSVATALRVHAEALRVKRRQRAEEAAAKTAVKLIFPLILCIFPTIFIVLAGPAAMKIAKTLGGPK